MSRMKWAALFLAAVLAGCSSGHRVQTASSTVTAPLVLSARDWSYRGGAGQQFQTAHYDIFTTHTDDDLVAHLPQLLETGFLHYQSIIKPTRQTGKRMEVYLFTSREQWNRFTDEIAGNSAPIYHRIQEGGYVHGGKAVFYDIRRFKTFAVTGHEAFHQYVWHYCRHRPPAWLDEGLACYFEGFYWDGEDLKFEPKKNQLRLRALQFALTQKSLLKLDELLATHPGEVIGGPPARVSSYYAQLWALIHFLREGRQNKYRPGFDRLLADVGTERLYEEAARFGYRANAADLGLGTFKAYFSSDLRTAEKELYDFCRELTQL